jgi:Leucine-rich repeat (LRR) protein
LPATLKTLYCFNNRLTRLPPLPATLKELSCSNNHLASLPQLPVTLEFGNFRGNPIYSILQTNSSIAAINTQLQVLHMFRFTFYSLKCKKRLRDFLWLKVREPKIKAQFNPQHLLERMTEDTNLDEFINEWVKTDVY